MGRRWVSCLSVFLVGGAISACGYNTTELSGEPPNTLGSVGGVDSGQVPGFAQVRAQLFEPYCLRCHSQAGGNRAGINLETFAAVKPLVARLQTVIASGAMPPNGGLPSSAASIFASWVAGGAPETATVSDAVPGGTHPQPVPNPGQCEDRRGGRRGDDSCEDD